MRVVFVDPDRDEPYATELNAPPREGERVNFGGGTEFIVENITWRVDVGPDDVDVEAQLKRA